MNEVNDQHFNDDGLEITAQMDINEIINRNTGAITGYKLIDNNGTVYELENGTNAIGRLKKANNIFIKDKFCSALHAEIYLDNNILTLVDQGSTNGTFVNGIRLAPGAKHIIMPGDEIGMGHTFLRVEAIRDDES